MDISVVVPLFNEEESIPELFAWIERVMKANGFSYEVIFVNDKVRFLPKCRLSNSDYPNFPRIQGR